MQRRVIDAVLLTAVAAFAVLQFGMLPALTTLNIWQAVALVAVAALTAPLHYGLMHETMHGNLFESEKANRAAGRLLGITLGLPFETMRFGHLAHHGFNRHDYDRPESLHKGEAWSGKALGYYFQLVIGNEFLYVLAPLPLLLPMSTTPKIVKYMNQSPDMEWFRNAALRTFTNPMRRRAIRIDLIAIVALFVFAFWTWGAHWEIFACCLLARWCVLSILDNAPHYAMPLDSGLDARNTTFPRPFRWLILNQNFHGVHHHSPQTPWHHLPASFAQQNTPTHGSWFAAQARQFRGPVQLPD
ncbi:MAG TPA: fatty acid desaturase [Rhizomicrobium sp.]|nr:fatty acid desaturase [Rhizomicrobium sp.]